MSGRQRTAFLVLEAVGARIDFVGSGFWASQSIFSVLSPSVAAVGVAAGPKGNLERLALILDGFTLRFSYLGADMGEIDAAWADFLVRILDSAATTFVFKTGSCGRGNASVCSTLFPGVPAGSANASRLTSGFRACRFAFIETLDAT